MTLPMLPVLSVTREEVDYVATETVTPSNQGSSSEASSSQGKTTVTEKWHSQKIKMATVLKTFDWIPFDPSLRTDNILFKMHYMVSVLFIALAFYMYEHVIFTFDVMSCIFSGEMAGEEWNTACWANSIYTIERHDLDAPWIPGKPGVVGFTDLLSEAKVRYNKYYQFTPFILLIQVMIFVTPHYLWKWWESGVVKAVSEGLKGPIVDVDEEDLLKKKKQLASYIFANWGYNSFYAMFFHFCELLNLLGVIFQLYMIDAMTYNTFTNQGHLAAVRSLFEPNPVQYSAGEDAFDDDAMVQEDPFQKAFPILGKCTVNTVGPSGNVIPHSGVCSLPLNLVSKWYFTMMWVYLSILAVWGAIWMVYRVAEIFVPKLRLWEMKDASIDDNDEDDPSECSTMEKILKNSAYGDWFFLTLLRKNVDAAVLNHVLRLVCEEMKERKEFIFVK